jgi:hypothetical protein
MLENPDDECSHDCDRFEMLIEFRWPTQRCPTNSNVNERLSHEMMATNFVTNYQEVIHAWKTMNHKKNTEREEGKIYLFFSVEELFCCCGFFCSFRL